MYCAVFGVGVRGPPPLPKVLSTIEAHWREHHGSRPKGLGQLAVLRKHRIEKLYKVSLLGCTFLCNCATIKHLAYFFKWKFQNSYWYRKWTSVSINFPNLKETSPFERAHLRSIKVSGLFLDWGRPHLSSVCLLALFWMSLLCCLDPSAQLLIFAMAHIEREIIAFALRLQTLGKPLGVMAVSRGEAKRPELAEEVSSCLGSDSSLKQWYWEVFSNNKLPLPYSLPMHDIKYKSIFRNILTAVLLNAI